MTGDLIEWADEIYVMEKRHYKKVMQAFRELLKAKPIHTLAIRDSYTFMDPELVAVIKRKFPQYFDKK